MATINGTDQSETLNGTENNDSISPGNGNDTVYGDDGDDYFSIVSAEKMVYLDSYVLWARYLFYSKRIPTMFNLEYRAIRNT